MMRPNSFSVAVRTLSIILILLILGFLYVWQIRPAQLRWGATPAEIARQMPEDASVTDPVFDATRAITIAATPQQIWPWLVQMGFGRAGFYGYDLIENLGSGTGIRSANSILPLLQNPQPGDVLPLSVVANLVYGPIEPNHFMVWKSANVPCDGVFIWELVPIDANHTRLISRIRWNYVRTPIGFALGAFTELADHIAVRKILKGIRDRAEGRPPESLITEGFELASIAIAALNLLFGIAFIICWRKWAWAWPLTLGAGLLLELVLYAGGPIALRAPLPWLYLVGIAVVWQKFGRLQCVLGRIRR